MWQLGAGNNPIGWLTLDVGSAPLHLLPQGLEETVIAYRKKRKLVLAALKLDIITRFERCGDLPVGSKDGALWMGADVHVDYGIEGDDHRAI